MNVLISIAVGCIVASCSDAWARAVGLTQEVLPVKLDDPSPRVHEPAHVEALSAADAGSSTKTPNHTSQHALRNSRAAFRSATRRDASFQAETDHAAYVMSKATRITGASGRQGPTNDDLAMLAAGTRGVMKASEKQNAHLSIVWWIVILVFGVPIVGALFLALICSDMSFFTEPDKAVLKGRVVDEAKEPIVRPSSPFQSQSERKSPAPSAPGRMPSIQSPRAPTVTAAPPPAEGLLRGSGERQAFASSGTNATTSSLLGSWTPQSLSRAVWSSGAIPPPLCAQALPSQAMVSFWISTKSLKELYNRSAIDVTNAFDYPVLRARLSYAPGGSRLEVSSEPSFHELSGCIGPVDRGNLSPQATLYGPGRELYGPIVRFGSGGGFAVGHFSRNDNVFTMTPRKTSDGMSIEISSSAFGGQQLASARMDGRARYQIDVNPGVDATLMITCVLGAFVASVPLIDHVGTTID